MVGCGVSVAELEKLGAKIERNEQGEVIAVSLRNTQITDARVADLQHQQLAPPRLAALDISYTYTRYISDRNYWTKGAFTYRCMLLSVCNDSGMQGV